ncbi:MAG TPA: response regulator transcription factor [Kiloniellales bacterium]|nr:response regulator transcription factor [Kiloniellales bacterium]
MTPAALLIADDDPVYRSFIREAIGESALGLVNIVEATDGESAVALAREHRPGCIVLDLQMPQLSGVEAARRIWADQPATRVLFWSNFADEAYVRSLARIVPSEASYGYLLKSTSRERLRVALEGVFLDGQCIVDRMIRDVQARTEHWLDALTDEEYDTLIDIALGFTDQAIAHRQGLSTRGVQSRLQRLYAKLGVSTAQPGWLGENAAFNPRTRAICVALMRGLVNPDLLRRANQKLGDPDGPSIPPSARS